jgi:hypothetical protein
MSTGMLTIQHIGEITFTILPKNYSNRRTSSRNTSIQVKADSFNQTWILDTG